MSTFPVIVSKNGKVFYGQWFVECDEPPVIEANGTRWYEHVWLDRGWTIEDDEGTP